MEMRVELRLYIDYDSGDFEDIRMQLYDAAEHLYDNGLLSGNDPDIEISSCTHSVTLVHPDREAMSVPTYEWKRGSTGPEGEQK
jgi:hypothetical protein